MGVGKRLKEFRNEKKLTQKIFSDILKVKQATISAYENDINMPSLENIIILAEYFEDLDLNWLLTGRTKTNITQTDILQLKLNEYKRTITVYEKAIEMLYEKYKEEK